MDWNAKWDWESFATFGSKATESPKKLQLVDWTTINDGEIDAGSFNVSSGSDGGHVSSAKSSISACEEFSGNFSKKMELKGTKVWETSPPQEASIGSLEPFIGLKLGKRTYFENNGAGGNEKSASLSVMPTLLKKTKSSGQNLHIPRCVVEGCDVDLSLAKEYHRKHRVCDNHSKCPKVIVGGHERRFCQQCSRFHNLSEFDDKKRSCRRRLSDHNARRRKPQQETIHFNSTRLSSPLYGGRQQMSFVLNNAPLIHSRNLGNTMWDSTSNSKFTLTKGFPEEQMHIPGIKMPHLINGQSDSAKGLLSSKSSITEVLNPGGSKGSQFGCSSSSHLDAAAPEYGRALSLLSSNSNSWGPPPPENMMPLSSSQFWPGHPHPTHEIQLFVTPYDSDLFPNILN